MSVGVASTPHNINIGHKCYSNRSSQGSDCNRFSDPGFQAEHFPGEPMILRRLLSALTICGRRDAESRLFSFHFAGFARRMSLMSACCSGRSCRRGPERDRCQTARPRQALRSAAKARLDESLPQPQSLDGFAGGKAEPGADFRNRHAVFHFAPFLTAILKG